MSPDSLLPLAAAIDVRAYPAGYVFHADDDSERVPLRVLCFGRVYWSSALYPQQKGAWMLLPGTIFGLQSINFWVDSKHPRRWLGRPPRVTAEAQSKVWVLELAHEAFDTVFCDPVSAEVLEALLELFPVSIHAPAIVRSMRETSQFSRVAAPRLYWLLQHAVAHCPTYDPPPVIAYDEPQLLPPPNQPGPQQPQPQGQAQQGQVQQQQQVLAEVEFIGQDQVHEDDSKTCLQYVLRGEVTASISGRPAITLRTGDMIGASELFTELAESKAILSIASGTWIASLTNAGLHRAMASAPTMAMMLGPAHPSDAECPDGGAASYPLLSSGTMTMVLADQAVDRTTFSLVDAVDGLGDAIVNDFGERVWVVHIVPQPAPPTPASGWLIEPPRTIEVPPAVNVELYVHAQLEDFGRHYGLFFDHILVEASAFDPDGLENGPLWRAMLGLSFPAQVDYIVDDSRQWELIPDWFLGISMVLSLEVQPLALLEPLGDLGPLFALIQDFQALLSGSSTVPSVLATLPQRIREFVERFIVVVTQVYGSTRFMPEAWPIDAVRLRLPDDPASATFEQLEAADASYSRWARAATSRRVGLAIGGAGALSFVALPYIRELVSQNVPIDLLSGASAGSFIGAFFSAMGERGLSRLEFSWPALEIGTLLAFYDNIPMTWWLAWATRYVDLTEIDLPVVSVATYAATGDSFQQTAGLVGKGLIASGSIPPLVSTFIGNDRFIDGGLTHDVPTAVLDAGGANLNLGVQPIPMVTPYPEIPEWVPIPYWKKWLVTLNPLVRSFDSIRAYMMIFRQAAFSEDEYADVFYIATTRFATAGFFWQVPRIIRQAENSPALQNAVLRTVALWQRLADLPPGRLRVDPVTGAVELGTALKLDGELIGGVVVLRGYTRRVLARLGEGVEPFVLLKLEVEVIWQGATLPAPSVLALAEQVVIGAIEQGAPGLPPAQRVISHSVDPNPALAPVTFVARYSLI